MIAMAAAAGISGIPTDPSADGRWKRGDETITQAIPIAAANAIHLSCWRSSPRARRSRTTREAAAARPSTNISSTPATWRLYPILKLVGAEAGALSPRFTGNGARTGPPVGSVGGDERAQHGEGGDHDDTEQPEARERALVCPGDPDRSAEHSHGGDRGAPRRDRGGSLLHPHLSCVGLPSSCALEASGGRRS